ncbi:serine--tRNA ligase [Paenibacillus selenitireducens]|uniref:Serine--tRNA ligase n=1 Tax=Paenibacillus selenitireducens TaxID=1324314 RepID=A0A1T2X1A5_9BACL|nr:serine--tRNA ligase [Paenibacillus selenitireducens]OPA73496.1 serine--tRNA ligase [Paenibacillus selenitireducens]
MLDMKFIHNHADQLQQIADQKGIAVSIAAVIESDVRRLDLLQQVEALRRTRNELAQRSASMDRASSEAMRIQAEARHQGAVLKGLERELRDAVQAWHELMLLVPNLASPDTPIGVSDADNVEVKRVGDSPRFGFDARDHIALGEACDLFDFARGVKVAGTRQYFLRGAGLYLHRAVQQLALDMLSDRGFTVMDVPLLAREDALTNTGFFPGGREQTYALPEDGAWLVGTGEVPLVSYYSDEIVDVTEPIKLAAVSNCFRREAGSAGRDVRGLYRVHQFAKVEQVILCRDDLDVAENMLQQLVHNSEELLEQLELPYRIVAVCTGDMGQKNYKQYDIETWMPSRDGYGETHSASSLLEFQARRSRIRYRDEEGQTRYCYTLNNTMVASPRILIPLIENHQQADESIRIPTALQPYMRGMTEIRPAK